MARIIDRGSGRFRAIGTLALTAALGLGGIAAAHAETGIVPISADITPIAGNIQGWTAVSHLLQQQVAPLPEGGIAGLDGGQSAVQLVVRHNGQEVFDEAFGYARKWDAGNNRRPVLRAESNWEPVSDNTIWDMASVTKVLATNLALQHLVYQGKLDVNDLVSKYIPAYRDYESDLALLDADHQFTGKDRTTVADLLHHTAGQFADPQYFNDNYLRSEVAQSAFGYLERGMAYEKLFMQNTTDPHARESIINAIVHTPLVSNVGDKQVYSDIDYMLLGLIVEKIAGMPLDEYCEKEIYQPLGLTHTMFNPLQKGFTRTDFAATEVNGNSRDGLRRSDGRFGNMFSFANMRLNTLQGEVHDEKAYYNMAGVSGHAGLFTTAHEAGILMQLMLNGGVYNGVRLFDQATVDKFTTPAKIMAATGSPYVCYGLGWWTNGLDYTYGGHCYGSYFSNLASSETFGHQGWAGPLVFADPEHDLAVVYMRNRPHNPVVGEADPNSFVNGGTTANTYGVVSDAVYRAIGLTDANLASALPDFGTGHGNTVHHDFSEGPLRVNVSFTDPTNGKTGIKIGPRNPMVLRVNVGASINSVARQNIQPLEMTEFTRDSGTYFFEATRPGDYYVRINDNTGAKMVRWITVKSMSATS